MTIETVERIDSIPSISVTVKPSCWEIPGMMAALRRYYAAGLSFSKIAQSLSDDFEISITRNSVAAKTFRIGLFRKVAPIPVDEALNDLPDDKISDYTKRKALVELQENECHWPYGDKKITFCCRPIDPASKYRPYCAEHRKVSERGYSSSPGKAKVAP